MSNAEQIARAALGIEWNETSHQAKMLAEWVDKNQDEKMKRLAALIADDGHAMSFQSMGQYRNFLLREITETKP